MNTQHTFTKERSGTIRACIISLLVPTVCYLWMTGITNQPRAWLFMVSFAVCLVLMLQSVVEWLVLGFAPMAKFAGRAVGLAFRMNRRLASST